MRNVYTQTNDAEQNEVVAFRSDEGGGLSPLGWHATGGKGSGKPHLASQSSIAISSDGGAILFVTNAGSDQLSVFTVGGGGLELDACVASGGASPTSVAVHGDLVYVLNNGGHAEHHRIQSRCGGDHPARRVDPDP